MRIESVSAVARALLGAAASSRVAKTYAPYRLRIPKPEGLTWQCEQLSASWSANLGRAQATLHMPPTLTTDITATAIDHLRDNIVFLTYIRLGLHAESTSNVSALAGSLPALGAAAGIDARACLYLDPEKACKRREPRKDIGDLMSQPLRVAFGPTELFCEFADLLDEPHEGALESALGVTLIVYRLNAALKIAEADSGLDVRRAH